jgi:hypothetical protein
MIDVAVLDEPRARLWTAIGFTAIVVALNVFLAII